MMGQKPRRRQIAFRLYLSLLLPNLALSLLIGAQFLHQGQAGASPAVRLYLALALLSNFLLLYLALSLTMAPLLLLVPRPRVVLSLSVLIFFVFQGLTLADLAVFRIFKFHINGMVINLFMTEGAWDSVRIGTPTLSLFAGALLLILAAEVMLALRLLRQRRIAERKTVRGGILWRALALTLLIILVDKAIYAASDLSGNPSLLRVSRLLPLYQPLTVKRFVERHFGLSPDQVEEGRPAAAGGLRYPLTPLQRRPLERYPNIVWIVIDGWRHDMLNREDSPQVWRFARRNQVFLNHLSGGNASRFGVFTLFYGVPGTYWRRFLLERRSPVLIDQLIDMGYDFSIISSTRLTYPEFRKTAFVRIPGAVEDRLGGDGAAARDPRAAGRLIRRLARGRSEGRPFFAFLFLDAPHGPYSYPDRFARHTPALQAANYLRAPDAASVLPLRNGYRNAVRFDDHLVGRILRAIEREGLLEDTIVLITGDHGEEFLESGFLGHTSAFSREQTQVPLVLHVPGLSPAVHRHLTSHLDAVPTMLTLLGCTTPPEAYSSGRPLLEAAGRQFVLVAGWDSSAIVDETTVLVFSTETYNSSLFEARDRDGYRLLPQARLPERHRQVAAAFREMTRFAE